MSSHWAEQHSKLNLILHSPLTPPLELRYLRELPSRRHLYLATEVAGSRIKEITAVLELTTD